MPTQRIGDALQVRFDALCLRRGGNAPVFVELHDERRPERDLIGVGGGALRGACVGAWLAPTEPAATTMPIAQARMGTTLRLIACCLSVGIQLGVTDNLEKYASVS
jgi:hypothetical protein